MTEQTISKNATGYGYKYADLSQVNEYIAKLGETYYQYIETQFNPVSGEAYDYIHTVRCNGEKETDLRGCRVIEAQLSNKSNAAQEAGSGLTYARRYSLYMAYGLATEDDDGEALTRPQQKKSSPAKTAKGVDFDEYREKVKNLTIDDLRREYIAVSTWNYTDKQKEALKKIIKDEQESRNE